MNYELVKEKLNAYENWMLELPMLLAGPVLIVTTLVMIAVTFGGLFLLGLLGWYLWQFLGSWL